MRALFERLPVVQRDQAPLLGRRTVDRIEQERVSVADDAALVVEEQALVGPRHDESGMREEIPLERHRGRFELQEGFGRDPVRAYCKHSAARVQRDDPRVEVDVPEGGARG